MENENEGSQYFVTDNTESGTILLFDPVPGPDEPDFAPLLEAGLLELSDGLGHFLFAPRFGRPGAASTDGTPGGTTITANFADATQGSNPAQIYPAGGRIYFGGKHNIIVTDGLEGEPRFIDNIGFGAADSLVYLGEYEEKVLFAYKNFTLERLVLTDGTSMGTHTIFLNEGNPLIVRTNAVTTSNYFYLISVDDQPGGPLWTLSRVSMLTGEPELEDVYFSSNAGSEFDIVPNVAKLGSSVYFPGNDAGQVKLLTYNVFTGSVDPIPGANSDGILPHDLTESGLDRLYYQSINPDGTINLHTFKNTFDPNHTLLRTSNANTRLLSVIDRPDGQVVLQSDALQFVPLDQPEQAEILLMEEGLRFISQQLTVQAFSSHLPAPLTAVSPIISPRTIAR